MEHDNEKIDDPVLALLWLGGHGEGRTWKTFDWGTMDRLHKAGWISNPKSGAKTVAFSETGARRAQELFEQMFTRRQ